MLYEVVPGEAATSLGIIELEVVFGSRRNFARHTLEFEVLDWQSQYWNVQRSGNSWRFRTTPTSNSRCQDPRASLQSTGASPNQTNVIAIFTKFPTPLEPSKNSQK